MVVKVAWNLRAGIPFLLFFRREGGGGRKSVAAKESAVWIARNGLSSKLSLKCFSVRGSIPHGNSEFFLALARDKTKNIFL